jgi:transcriptional regulator with XRE-family HTH domain
MKNNEINLGLHVRKQMNLKGIKQAELARELGLHARSIPQFIRRKHYNTKMLIRLCNILEHDFLQYLYADNESNVTYRKLEETRKENEELRKEISFLKTIIGKIK